MVCNNNIMNMLGLNNASASGLFSCGSYSQMGINSFSMNSIFGSGCGGFDYDAQLGYELANAGMGILGMFIQSCTSKESTEVSGKPETETKSLKEQLTDVQSDIGDKLNALGSNVSENSYKNVTVSSEFENTITQKKDAIASCNTTLATCKTQIKNANNVINDTNSTEEAKTQARATLKEYTELQKTTNESLDQYNTDLKEAKEAKEAEEKRINELKTEIATLLEQKKEIQRKLNTQRQEEFNSNYKKSADKADGYGGLFANRLNAKELDALFTTDNNSNVESLKSDTTYDKEKALRGAITLLTNAEKTNDNNLINKALNRVKLLYNAYNTDSNITKDSDITDHYQKIKEKYKIQ